MTGAKRGELTFASVADIPQSPIAPIEVRDFVYGKLIELSPATLYPGALIAGEKGLLARGLSECHFGNYGGLPAGSSERDRIARLLLQEMNGHFSSRRFAAGRSRILGRQAGRSSLEAERLSPAEIAHSRARWLGAHSSLPDATAVRREEGAAIPLALLFRSAARNRLGQPAPFQVPSRRSSARRPDCDRRGRAQGRRPLTPSVLSCTSSRRLA